MPNNLPAMDMNTHTELGNAPEPQLYHVTSDPGELHNLATQEPERVRALSALLQKIQ